MKNILIIENDGDSLALLKEILEEKGYNALGASHIDNGLAVLRQGIAIDLILVSTIIENAETYDHIKIAINDKLSASIPTIALTSSQETNEGVRAMEEGCVAYIARPIEEAELLKIVKSVLGKRGK